jgi:hypothetical protein
MKRRRRVEIRVERHELSIYAGTSSGPVHPAEAHPADISGDSNSGTVIDAHLVPAGLRRTEPDVCPICGSQNLIPLADAIARTGGNSSSLKDGLESGIFHLHCSSSGEWWVCGQSLTPG